MEDVHKVRGFLLKDMQRLRRCEGLIEESLVAQDLDLADIAFEARRNYLKEMRLWVSDLGGLDAAW